MKDPLNPSGRDVLRAYLLMIVMALVLYALFQGMWLGMEYVETKYDEAIRSRWTQVPQQDLCKEFEGVVPPCTPTPDPWRRPKPSDWENA